MARARNIKPGFYKNEDLAECSIWARFIFPGLWMLADREGRLEDRPKRIKGELLAFDSVDVDPLLVELQARGFILRYTADGASYIQILKFKEHQAPHYSEKESVIPSPFPAPIADDDTVIPGKLPESSGHDESKNPGTLPENSGNEAGIKRGSQPPDSLIPDSLIPESLSPPPPGAAGRKPSVSKSDWPGFPDFYQPYPRKEAKSKALEAWNKLRPSPETVVKILADVRKRAASFDWQKEGGRFVPQPATYLNQRRWEDESVPPPPPNGAHVPVIPTKPVERYVSDADVRRMVGE